MSQINLSQYLQTVGSSTPFVEGIARACTHIDGAERTSALQNNLGVSDNGPIFKKRHKKRLILCAMTIL